VLTLASRLPTSFVDRIANFFVREGLETLSLRHLLAMRPHICNCSAHTIQGFLSLRNNPRHGLIVPGDYNLFATRHALQEFS
jgi:hypothetical protein